MSLKPPEARQPSSSRRRTFPALSAPCSPPARSIVRAEGIEPAQAPGRAVNEYRRCSLTDGRRSNCASCEARPAKDVGEIFRSKSEYFAASARRGAHSGAAAVREAGRPTSEGKSTICRAYPAPQAMGEYCIGAFNRTSSARFLDDGGRGEKGSRRRFHINLSRSLP